MSRGFRYKFGDRPLEGYTIQRGVGRGGFGEVYYALSDAGREVALKLVQGFEQVELRGVGQCMNLKSPHLVTIFDVRHDDAGTPWVIMEYVNGPTLRQLLDESPGGLGVQKTAYFLREIGKGLSLLHECGIVHRDLKPGNIFYENGVVKIGDYGLSKAMAPSHNSGQTITVGTLHYMAPEIGAGKYDQGIDIYALGAVIFEMATGQVPFLGASPTEILMKHMSVEADVSRIEEPFASVIRRCMEKDPARRFKSVQEVVEAVFGTEHVRQSVSCFSPESLSYVAQRVANRVAAGGGSNSPVPPSAGGGVAVGEGDVWSRLGGVADRVGRRLTKLGGRFVCRASRWFPAEEETRRVTLVPPPPVIMPPPTALVVDPLKRRHRVILSAMLLVLLTVVVGVLGEAEHHADGAIAFATPLWTTGVVAGLLMARRRLLPHLAGESAVIRHLAAGGMALAGGTAIGFLAFAAADGRTPEVLASTALAVALPLFLIDWSHYLRADRPARVSFVPIAIGVPVAVVASLVMDGSAVLAAGVVAGVCLLGQILCTWGRTMSSATSGATVDPAGRGVVVPAPPGPPLPPSPPMPPSPPAASGAPVAATPLSPLGGGGGWTRAIASFFGWVVLLVSFAVGVQMALDVPGMVILSEQRPGRAWDGPPPSLFRLISLGVTALGMFAATVLLIVGRQRSGAAHVVRAIVAVLVLCATCAFLYQTCQGRGGISAIANGWPGRPAAQVIEQYLSGLSLPMLATSFVMGIFGLTLLGWPAARARREVNS